MATISEVDAAIGRYYQSLNVPYNSLFATYCDDNGIDEETVADEIILDPNESILVDFDDEFPFPQAIKDKSTEFIHNIIKQVYHQPDTEFSSYTWGIDIDLSDTEIEEFKNLFQSQCALLWGPFTRYASYSGCYSGNRPISNKNALFYLMTLGYKHYFDYPLYFVREWTKYRIENDIKISNSKNRKQYKRWIDSKMHSHDRKMKEIVMDAINTFNFNVGVYESQEEMMHYPKQMAQFYLAQRDNTIDDSMQITIRYLISVCDLIYTLINNSNNDNKNDEEKNGFSPFQIDLTIYYGKPLSKYNSKWEDKIGDIKKKLTSYNALRKYAKLKYKHEMIDGAVDKIVKAFIRFSLQIENAPSDIIDLLTLFIGDFQYKLSAAMLKLYKDFKQKLKDKSYPNYKRFKIFVDRRNRDKSNDDDIWMYEPGNGRDIPKNALSYWYFNYTANDTAYRNNEAIIGYSRRDSLLTLSFHVKKRDDIKCYLYWYYEMLPFIPKYFAKILSMLFNMEWKKENISNKSFVENDILINQLIDKLQTIISDERIKNF